MRKRAVALACHYSIDPAEAEDAVQEALVRAWRKRTELEDPQRLWPWLARIVINEALRIRSRRRPEPVAEPAWEEGREDDGLVSAPARIDLSRGLEALEEEERALLRLRYELDLTQAVIAERLGCPEGTVKVRLHRARARLRRALQEEPFAVRGS